MELIRCYVKGILLVWYNAHAIGAAKILKSTRHRPKGIKSTFVLGNVSTLGIKQSKVTGRARRSLFTNVLIEVSGVRKILTGKVEDASTRMVMCLSLAKNTLSQTTMGMLESIGSLWRGILGDTFLQMRSSIIKTATSKIIVLII